MINSRFKHFIDCVATCGEDDPIWWSGYLFLDLTEKQIKKTFAICAERFGTTTDKKGRIMALTPSGIQIYKID